MQVGRPGKGVRPGGVGCGFSRSCRLLKRGEFSWVFSFGRSVADRHFVVYTRNNDLGRSRLGLSVGRRVGGAIQRNRIKRLLREAFRLSRSRISQDLDVVVVVRGQGSPDQLKEVRDALVQLVERSARAQARPRKGGSRRRGR